MIISNEPGYYKAGAYGIRIENLVLVTAAETPPGGERKPAGLRDAHAGADRPRPDRPSAARRAELTWLDGYHARVREILTPLIDDDTRHWLDAATRPL